MTTTTRRLAGILTATSMMVLTQTGVARAQLHASSAGYELQLLVDGRPVPTFFHDAESYAMGQVGERYTIRVLNHTGRRIEAVVSVDGRDVVDGKTAGLNKRGYLVPAWGSVDIEGWRLSQAQVAAFRFSSVAQSYAARTGSARDVGVVGAAIFTERRLPPPRPLYLPPPPCERCGEWEGPYGYRSPESRRAESPSADSSAGAAAPSAKGRAAESPAPAPSAQAESTAPSYRGDGAGARDRSLNRSRPGLGTEFGEAMGSQVREVEFVRSSSSPMATLGLRYNDRDGLVAMGVDVDAWYGYGDDDSTLRRTATPFPGERRYAQPPRGWLR